MITEDGTPKILDFGLARIIDPDPVQTAEESSSHQPLGEEDETRLMDQEEHKKAAAMAEGLRSLTRGGVLIGTPSTCPPNRPNARRPTAGMTELVKSGKADNCGNPER